MALPSKETVKLLREAYEDKGYIRVKMDKRQGGVRTGWEIRFRANGPREVRVWAQALRGAGIMPGRPYARGLATVLPVYGRAQVEQFLTLVKPRRKGAIPEAPDNVDLRTATRPRRR